MNVSKGDDTQIEAPGFEYCPGIQVKHSTLAPAFEANPPIHEIQEPYSNPYPARLIRKQVSKGEQINRSEIKPHHVFAVLRAGPQVIIPEFVFPIQEEQLLPPDLY